MYGCVCMDVYVCVDMCVCMCAYMHVCICAYAFIYVYVNGHVDLWIDLFCVDFSLHMHVCKYVSIM